MTGGYTKLPGGFRERPGPDGRLAYIKTGNEELRSIPARDRLLEVVCHQAGSAKGPRLVAVVSTGWAVVVVGNPDATTTPGRLLTRCRCGPDGHSLSLARLAAEGQTRDRACAS
jgi:hypothetical protein